MSKSQKASSTSTRSKASPAQASASSAAPTQAQLERLSAAEKATAAIDAEHGPVSTQGAKSYTVPPVLEEALQTVERFINTANVHYKLSQERSAAADLLKRDMEAARGKLDAELAKERARHTAELTTERSEQKRALGNERAQALAEVATLRAEGYSEVNALKESALQEQAEERKRQAAEHKRVTAELSARRAQLEQAEGPLSERAAALDAKELDLVAREAEVSSKLIELRQREQDATAGFEVERARVLKEAQEELARALKERRELDAELAAKRHEALLELQRAAAERQREHAARREEELRALRDEHAALEREITTRKVESLSALREEGAALERELVERRAQEQREAHERALERAASWAAEEERHLNEAGARRRAVDEELAALREERLAELRVALQEERARAEEELATSARERDEELNARAAALDERAQGLEARDEELRAQRKELREERLDLSTDQEVFKETREDFESRVARTVDERTEQMKGSLSSLERQLADTREERDHLHRQNAALSDFERRFGGREPDEVLRDLNTYKQERDALAQQLRERLDAKAAERLATLERERDEWLDERMDLMRERAHLQAELDLRRISAVKLETLQSEKEALEVHKKVLTGAVDELRARVEDLTSQDHNRDPLKSLTALDEDHELNERRRTIAPMDANHTFEYFASDLRHRVARGVEGRELFYSERDLRCFLGGLSMTRLLLLQGISGTGKTSLPLAFAKAIGAGVAVVEVQAGWRDRQDLIGYYNAFHRHYYATNFLQALYKAGTPAYRDRPFLIILDEMNLSRPEQFFADFLSALEQPQAARRLTLMSDPITPAPRLLVEGRHLPIPPNVWFVGTANHDESTAEFADKTYDRAHVMEMPRNTGAARFKIDDKNERPPISYQALDELFKRLAHSYEEQVVGANAWLSQADFTTTLQTQFRLGWGNRLEAQMRRYIPAVLGAGGTIGEAMDHLLATKLLRKLRDRHDVHLAGLEQIKDELLNEWESLDVESLPESCIELLDHEIQAKRGEGLS